MCVFEIVQQCVVGQEEQVAWDSDRGIFMGTSWGLLVLARLPTCTLQLKAPTAWYSMHTATQGTLLAAHCSTLHTTHCIILLPTCTLQLKAHFTLHTPAQWTMLKFFQCAVHTAQCLKLWLLNAHSRCSSASKLHTAQCLMLNAHYHTLPSVNAWSWLCTMLGKQCNLRIMHNPNVMHLVHTFDTWCTWYTFDRMHTVHVWYKNKMIHTHDDTQIWCSNIEAFVRRSSKPRQPKPTRIPSITTGLAS